MKAKKISLGTAQWGMVYGLSNLRGQTNNNEISKILSVAYSEGIKFIDTAMAYGNAEAVLGKHQLNSFSIITKTPKFVEKVITKFNADELIRIFKQSLKTMNCESCYGLLLHQKEDILKSGWENLVEAMNTLKSDGFVKKIGISIYDTSDIDLILYRLNPDIVQLPLNVLDQRVINDGTLLKYMLDQYFFRDCY